MDHGEHIFVWSLRRTVSSYRITICILRLPDNYNRRTGLQASVGGARVHCMHACMRRRADITIIFSYKLIIKKAISNRKTKPMGETKTAQYKHDIEMHFTEKEKKGHKQEN